MMTLGFLDRKGKVYLTLRNCGSHPDVGGER